MIWTCSVRVACRSCSTVSTRPRRWGRCCGSSPSATPASWSRCSASTCAPWPNVPSCWSGSSEQAFIDIDSLLRPVYGHAKQGASYGHTKIAGKQVLRKGLSPLATTISTAALRPVVAGMRLRAGKTGSGQGAGRHGRRSHRHRAGRRRERNILVRGDAAYGNRAVDRALRGNVEFSLVLTKNRAIARAIASIPDTAWTPVRYPGAVQDPDTGASISDAEVAEVTYTAFAATVKDLDASGAALAGR